jgi:hypothetical protein
VTKTTPINPLFRASLPQMIERMEGARRKVREALNPIAVDIRALSDFLSFEISRTQLELDRAEWSSQADTAAIDDRGRYLAGMLETVGRSQMDQLTDHMEHVLAILKRLEAEPD